MAAYKGEFIDIDTSSIITVMATSNLSGGMLVASQSGAWANAVTATGTRNVYTTGHVAGYVTTTAPSGTVRAIGMALQDAASGSYVAIVRKGLVILPNNGAGTTAGTQVGAAVAAAASAGCVGPTTTAGNIIGNAYNASTSGGYTIVALDC